MAFVTEFLDSFDHYNTANIGKKWSIVNGQSISATAARNGASGLITNGAEITRNLGNQPNKVFGAGFKLVSAPSNIFPQFIKFSDNAVQQINLAVDAAGHILAQRSNSNVLLGTSVATAALAVYNWIELGVIVDPTAGVVIVKLNGATILNLTAQNTRATSLNRVNQITLGCSTGGAPVVHWDDVYMGYDSNPAVLTFLGDSPVTPLFASGAGAFANFVRAGTNTGANWSQTTDNPPNSGTKLNASNILNDRDSFVHAALGAGTPVAAMLWALAQKDNSGARGISLAVRSGATDFIAAAQALAQGYLYYGADVSIDPATAALITLAGMNAEQIGYKVTL